MSHPYEILEQPWGWMLARDTDAPFRCSNAGRLDWDEEMRELPELRAIKPGDLAVDAGAFIGSTVRIWEALGCEVFAFEAQPDALYCLRHNVSERTHVFQAVLGDGRWLRVTQDECCRPNGGLGKRMCVPDQAGEPSLRLDDFRFPRRAALLKIDVEGCEPWVIAGAERMIQNDRPLMLVEMNREALERWGTSPAALYRQIEDLGYGVRHLSDDSDWHDLVCVAR